MGKPRGLLAYIIKTKQKCKTLGGETNVNQDWEQLKAKQIMLSSCCFILSFIINSKYNLHGSKVSCLHVKHFFLSAQGIFEELAWVKKNSQ